MASQDYYEILGVPKNATQDQIKRSFKKRAAALHPDNKDTGNESEFKDLVAAYEVLSDEQKRDIYDHYGAEGLKGTRSQFSDMDFGAFGDLSDIFDLFFTGGTRSSARRRAEAARGADLKYDLEIDFLEAVTGCKKNITIKHLRICHSCKGTGAAPGSSPTRCTTCAGQGQVRQTAATLFGHFTQILPCPACNGEGTKIEHPCHDCHGTGQIRKPRTIELQVPPGVDTGSRMRVSGGGDEGKKNSPPGDLYVIIHVREHSHFIREGITIHVEQPISYSMAALGGELVIETVNGKKILKITPGTQTGTTLTMRDLGVPHLSNPSHKGDMQVHLFVQTPTRLSAEEKQLLERLAELRGESLDVKDKDTVQSQGKEGDQSLLSVISGLFGSKNTSDEH